MGDCCSNNREGKVQSVDLKNLDGLICYCFEKSKKELFNAVKNGEEALIIEDIKLKIKNPGCFCKTANPSGKCCLPDVQEFIRAIYHFSNDKA